MATSGGTTTVCWRTWGWVCPGAASAGPGRSVWASVIVGPFYEPAPTARTPDRRGSAGGPGERPPAEDVEVGVEDALLRGPAPVLHTMR